MRICIKIGNVEHCYNIPVYEYPVRIFKPGPGPVNFPALFHDATVIAGIEDAITKVSDKGVRTALEGGLRSAVKTLQERGGAHISSIQLGEG